MNYPELLLNFYKQDAEVIRNFFYSRHRGWKNYLRMTGKDFMCPVTKAWNRNSFSQEISLRGSLRAHWTAVHQASLGPKQFKGSRSRGAALALPAWSSNAVPLQSDPSLPCRPKLRPQGEQKVIGAHLNDALSPVSPTPKFVCWGCDTQHDGSSLLTPLWVN